MKSFLMTRVWCGMSAALLVMFPAFASAEDPMPDSFRELKTKYIFGFTFGSDIGPEGERAGNANFLDLTNFSRNKALLRAMLEF